VTRFVAAFRAVLLRVGFFGVDICAYSRDYLGGLAGLSGGFGFPVKPRRSSPAPGFVGCGGRDPGLGLPVDDFWAISHLVIAPSACHNDH
jgi:hypothetical protein